MNEIPESALSHEKRRRSRERSSSVMVPALAMVLAAGVGGAAAFGLESRSAWIVLPIVGATVPFWPRLVASMGGSSYRAASTPLARWSVTRLEEPIRWLTLSLLTLAFAAMVTLWLLKTPPTHVFRYASFISLAALVGYAAWQFFPPATLGRRTCACFVAWTIGICGNWAASETDRDQAAATLARILHSTEKLHEQIAELSEQQNAGMSRILERLEQFRDGAAPEGRRSDLDPDEIRKLFIAYGWRGDPEDPDRRLLVHAVEQGDLVSAIAAVGRMASRDELTSQDVERHRAQLLVERSRHLLAMEHAQRIARIDLLLAMMPPIRAVEETRLDDGAWSSAAHTSFFGALIRSGDGLERAIGAVAMATMSGESALWNAADRAIASARATVPSDPSRQQFQTYALLILEGDRELARADAMGALDLYLQSKETRQSGVVDLRLEIARAELRRLSQLALTPQPEPAQVSTTERLESAPLSTTIVPVGSNEDFVPLLPLRATGTAANLLLNAQRLEQRMACTTCTGGGQESYEVQVGERRAAGGFLVEKVMETRKRRCTKCGGSGFGDAKQAKQSLEGFAIAASRVRVLTGEDDNRIVLSIPEVMRALKRQNRMLPTLNDDARSIFARALISEPTPIWFSGRITGERRVIQNGEEVQLVTIRSGVDQRLALLANPIIRGASAERAEVYVFGLCTGIHTIDGSTYPIIQNAVVLSP